MAEDKRPTLEVEERSERGSRAARRMRRSGLVPGIVYGGTDSDPVSFKVPALQLRNLLVEGSALIDLKVGDADAKPVIVKDQQLHPVREDVVHIDFLEVRLDEKIHATVAVELEGVEESPGVTEGGVIDQVTRELNIEALPTDIPERVTVDVSGLEIASTLTLAEVRAPAGVEFLDDPEETTIATVVVPTEVEEPEVEEETELIGEDGEPIEVPEGEEAPEGEGQAAAGEAPVEGGGDSGGDGGGE
jgi:large subunit ribosomal protein L25